MDYENRKQEKSRYIGYRTCIEGFLPGQYAAYLGTEAVIGCEERNTDSYCCE